ncbi:GNAT family N-acetyltransferase [Paenibacillus silviterrae]|uniref:GNAT family N-acetyltransferase n=1 Tax=Paenibacillus silviterrae TaxID=3242194 RepID=UPI002543F873|nr:GNAT family N-acetyltransferase [Paenibacillus chinjuensis]
MTTEIRIVRPQEMEAAARLADATFRGGEQKSMAEAFPLVFSRELEQSFGVFESGELVAFMGVVPAIIAIGDAQLRVYSLGSVCTHPDHRGKGYAGQLLEAVKKHIDAAGASLLLVSGDRSLYTRARCYPFGNVTHFTLNPETAAAINSRYLNEAGHVTVRELAQTDWFRIHALASARTVRYEQSLSELARMVNAESFASCVKLRHRVLVAEEQGNNGIAAFAVVAIPDGLEPKRGPLAIEWAGPAPMVAHLLSEAVGRYELSELDVPVSRFDTELAQALQDSPSAERNNSVTLFVVNAERLFRQLAPYWTGTEDVLSQSLRVESLEDGAVRLSAGTHTLELDARQFVSLVFDAEPQLEADADALRQLAKLFPVPFPYASGLNYV